LHPLRSEETLVINVSKVAFLIQPISRVLTAPQFSLKAFVRETRFASSRVMSSALLKSEYGGGIRC
jgi:hypothetical protein